jgi:hypothetical protein
MSAGHAKSVQRVCILYGWGMTFGGTRPHL